MGQPPMNLFAGSLAQRNGQLVFLETVANDKPGMQLELNPESTAALASRVGQSILLGIHPAHVSPVASGGIGAVIHLVERTGATVWLHGELKSGSHRFSCRAPEQPEWKVGEKIQVRFDLVHACYFDASTQQAIG
jgi:ABC-type sugar transport system ATPase subunit